MGCTCRVPGRTQGFWTHPEPDKLRQQFAYHYETLHGRWLNNSQLPEEWLDAAAALHKVLDGSFDRPRP
jgi:hypothetical protein